MESYLDALVEDFSPSAFKAANFPPRAYIEESQTVREILEKLFGRLSILLFHIDKKMNKVLIQGRRLPRKLNQWATEARAMKCQVHNLLQEQQNRKGNSCKREEWMQIGIKMINLVDKCPFKDEMMYDKPTPVIIQKQESRSEKLSRRLDEKHKVKETPFSHLEGKKMEHKSPVIGQSFGSFSFTAVEVQKKNVAATPIDNFGSGPISITEIVKEESSDMHHAAISAISSADPNSSSISEYQNEPQFNNEITEEGEQGETEPTPSKAERSNEHEEGIIGPISFQEKGHYSVVVENNNLLVKLDNQSHIILIQDYPSAPSIYRSPVKGMLDLTAQDLRELKEKPNYPNSLFLFLQRNNRLTSIHSSFFDSMPDLRFLDMSDTKIRILPSSLFKLSELKVLLLRNCICLEKLQGEIKNLNNIETLDLLGTELYELPDEIGQLTLLKSLKLSFYGPDDESEYEHLPYQLISPGFLSKLKELQSLSISVHPEDHRWTEIAAQIVEDISKLEMLNYLEFYFPEVKIFEEFIEMSTSLKKQKLSNFHFIVGQNVKRIVSRVPDEAESFFNQQERRLRYVNGDKASPWIKTMLIHVKAFYLDHHTEAQSLSEFSSTNLQALKFCIVRECPKIRTLLDGENGGSAFPSLEYLGIYFLWELNHIWKPHSVKIWKTPKPSENFKVLRYLIINTCPKLQFILWESMLYSLANLEELIVEDCERVEKIIKAENKKVKHMDNVLPRLRKLVLHYLPELVSVGNGVRLSEEKVTYNGCPKFVLDSEPPR